MTAEQSFAEATRGYEAWRASRIAIVTEDVEVKHAKLATSAFVLLRGTYYRFLEQFGAALPPLAGAPATIVVGDLHIENFGTWRDRDGRLCWGINDFDEIDMLPYAIDLVRLATSAVLAFRAGHLALHPHEACDAIHTGWRERIEQHSSEPFVLAERHKHLYKLASEAIEPPERFARRLDRLAPWDGQLPAAAARLLAQVVPWRGYAPVLRRRVAGVGSLGARRIVAIGALEGGAIVREAKQIPGPASMWLRPRRDRVRGLAGLVTDARGMAADPWRRQSGNWVVRRLASDATRLELAALRRKHDEAAVLRSMGAEAANVHLCPHARAAPPAAVRKDDDSREANWLLDAAEAMAELTERDHSAWCDDAPDADPPRSRRHTASGP